MSYNPFNNQVKLDLIWVNIINFSTWHVYDSIDLFTQIGEIPYSYHHINQHDY